MSNWNVNQWHWEERNLTEWSKERLTELLSSYVFSSVDAHVTKVSKIEGDAIVNIRKGRKIVGYEMEIVLDWEGKIEDGEGEEAVKTSGSLRFPEVCEEVEDMDFKWEVTTTRNTPGDQRLKNAVSEEAREVRELIRKWVGELAEQ